MSDVSPEIVEEMAAALRFAEHRLRVNEDYEHPGTWDRRLYEVIAVALHKYEERNREEAR